MTSRFTDKIQHTKGTTFHDLCYLKHIKGGRSNLEGLCKKSVLKNSQDETCDDALILSLSKKKTAPGIYKVL